MWELLLRLRGLTVAAEDCLFVGDAAGRPARRGRKADFSASDLLFALNVGCSFRTPESLFLGSTDLVDNPSAAPSACLRVLDLVPPYCACHRPC